MAQFVLLVIGGCLLMIAGESELPIRSMVGSALLSKAMMLKWGLPFG